MLAPSQDFEHSKIPVFRMKQLTSLSQLLVFAKVAETNNLTKAASELGITPSAVSKSLSLFEKRMGISFVKRTSRHTSLTEQGQLLFNKIASSLNNIENILEELEAHKTYPKGILRISCPVAFGSIQVMPLVDQYRSRYPDVDIHISLDDRNINLIEENFDLALRITASKDWNYTAKKLAQIRWIYCASPSYIERYGLPSSIDDIHNPSKHKHLPYPTGEWTPWHDGDANNSVKIQGNSDCNSSMSLMIAALHGAGIACLPTYIAKDCVLDGKLRLLAFTERPEKDQILYAMYFQNRYTNPLTRTFIDYLVEKTQPIPPWDRDLREQLAQ